MKFNCYERLMLGNLLPILIPAESNRMIYAMLDKIALELSLSQKELDKIEYKTEGQKYRDEEGKEITVDPGMVRWNPLKNIDKNIDIPQIISELLISKFKELDEGGKLKREAVPIFDKFIDETKWFKKENKDEEK